MLVLGNSKDEENENRENVESCLTDEVLSESKKAQPSFIVHSNSDEK